MNMATPKELYYEKRGQILIQNLKLMNQHPTITLKLPSQHLQMTSMNDFDAE